MSSCPGYWFSGSELNPLKIAICTGGFPLDALIALRKKLAVGMVGLLVVLSLWKMGN